VRLVTVACLQIVASIQVQAIFAIQRAADSDASHVFHRGGTFGDKASFTHSVCGTRRMAAGLTCIVLV
jgi:hypothetical protein